MPARPAAPIQAKSLGVAACTAIVMGNMVGSGFYLSPSAIAPYGLLAIVMWMVMGAGALCLGLAFARLRAAGPGDWRALCVFAVGLWRLCGISRGMGILDLHLDDCTGQLARREDRRSGCRNHNLFQDGALRRDRNHRPCLFLMADRSVAGTISVEVATMSDEFIWVLQDTAAFIAGRIVFAVERYVQSLLPPFASALARYDREREYSWAARDIRTLFIPIRSRTSPRGTSERAGSRGG
jgi:hypothetical protein